MPALLALALLIGALACVFALQNAVPVILLAVIIASAVSVVTAIVALYFKDRERARFFYSLVLVVLIGGSYFLNPSPFGLITRLAAGDPGLRMLQVGFYAIPLVVVSMLFLKLSRRLVLSKR